MNKQEKLTLAKIVVRMVYDADSDKNVVAKGLQIINKLPCISNEVSALRYEIVMKNLCKFTYNVLNTRFEKTYKCRPRIARAMQTLTGLIESHAIRISNQKIYDIESRLIATEPHLHDDLLSEMLESTCWRQDVLAIYEESTPEYRYFCSKQ